MTEEEDDRTAAVAAIRRYLADCPYAADTLEGIVQWWLQREGCEPARDVVQHALDSLVASGLVMKLARRGGDTLYVSVVLTLPPKPSQ